MARVIVHESKLPLKFDKPVSICMCGLSSKFPICDGNHKKIVDEDDELYIYDENLVKTKVEIYSRECSGECNCEGDCHAKEE
jgi:CDGSH-type Zn-finger protein